MTIMLRPVGILLSTVLAMGANAFTAQRLDAVENLTQAEWASAQSEAEGASLSDRKSVLRDIQKYIELAIRRDLPNSMGRTNEANEDVEAAIFSVIGKMRGQAGVSLEVAGLCIEQSFDEELTYYALEIARTLDEAEFQRNWPRWRRARPGPAKMFARNRMDLE